MSGRSAPPAPVCDGTVRSGRAAPGVAPQFDLEATVLAVEHQQRVDVAHAEVGAETLVVAFEPFGFSRSVHEPGLTSWYGVVVANSTSSAMAVPSASATSSTGDATEAWMMRTLACPVPGAGGRR